MRVIAGKAKHIQLVTVPGMETRPTTDRIKETLFNMLQPYIPGSRFLDLFSGSGAIGIEALSRGAECCDFVENNPKAVTCITDNLKKTNLSEARVYKNDVFLFLDNCKPKKPYDIVFMDPPYRHLFEKTVLEHLAVSDIINDETLIIFEASLDTEFYSYVGELGFTVIKVKTYKTNQHIFLQRTGQE